MPKHYPKTVKSVYMQTNALLELIPPPGMHKDLVLDMASLHSMLSIFLE